MALNAIDEGASGAHELRNSNFYLLPLITMGELPFISLIAILFKFLLSE